MPRAGRRGVSKDLRLALTSLLAANTTLRMSTPVLSYVNRHGVTYHLHQGTTKTGKPRYFVARLVGNGALAALPEGYEFSESINGVVSVRRLVPNAPEVPAGHLATVRAELARHPHLRWHRAEAVRGDIVVYEPECGFAGVEALAGLSGRLRGEAAARLAHLQSHTRFFPVLEFVACTPDLYEVRRMTYRGEGGWSWPLAHGPLATLARRFLPVVGTEQFFELL